MVGRQYERSELLKAFLSENSEFVAVYGRRRVGKTYLVRGAFEGHLLFQHAGLKNKATKIQLDRFQQSLVESGYLDCPLLPNWYKAFDALKVLVQKSQEKKKVIFIDEMPWMDRPNSNFLSALENFWNAWASARKDILLIVCGSAASWVLKRVVHNKEGLHNRVTYRIPLQPFSLRECEEYAVARNLGMNRRQIAECYMVLGGIPYYWHFLDKGMSVVQNIDELFFAGHDKLEDEFSELYESLFQSPDPYVAIVTALASKKIGMTREEISGNTGLGNDGKLSGCLADLEHCGFIRKYIPFGKANRGSVYQLMDNYTLFYFQFIVPNRRHDPHYWTKMTGTPRQNAWSGLAFERLCLQHADQIREALGIRGVNATVHSWRGPHSQIDMLIDRDDNVVNVCEMKFANDEYALTAEDEKDMRRKIDELKAASKTRKSVHATYVTSCGLAANPYAKDVQSEVTLEDLFHE